MIGNFWRHWKEASLAAASVLVSYVFLDVAYRVYQYRVLPEKLFAIVAQSRTDTAPTTYRFDAFTGFSYIPNFEGRRGAPWFSHWRTNSHGHVSDAEYPERKPAGEYRIAVLGDSFTANITNNVRWTDLVERHLNDSARWKAAVGGRYTRVINFGVDGMGMVQFAAMLRHHGMKFEPDLVIVNFISDDILRKLHFPDTSPRTDDRDADLAAYIKTEYIDTIKWFRIYPELFAATIGRYWNMNCGLPLDARVVLSARPNFRYQDREEAIRESVAAMREMMALSPRILFLQQPVYEEVTNQAPPKVIGLMNELRSAAVGANIIDMKPRMEALLYAKLSKDSADVTGLTHLQIASLPVERQPETHRWFFLPEDLHYTDYATTLYGREVANYLIETAAAELPGTPGKYSAKE